MHEVCIVVLGNWHLANKKTSLSLNYSQVPDDLLYFILTSVKKARTPILIKKILFCLVDYFEFSDSNIEKINNRACFGIRLHSS